MADATGAGAPASPFRGLALPASAGVCAVTETCATARHVLRADPETAAALAGLAALPFPAALNRIAAERERALLVAMLGPDEWLVWATPDTAARVLQDLARAKAAGHVFALVDVSDRFCGMDLVGPAVEDVIASGCPLPLDPAGFPVGRVTRTVFHRTEIILARMDSASFRLECGRSFLPYVAHHLTAAVVAQTALLRHQSDPR